jgi:hypothetical protein
MTIRQSDGLSRTLTGRRAALIWISQLATMYGSQPLCGDDGFLPRLDGLADTSLMQGVGRSKYNCTICILYPVDVCMDEQINTLFTISPLINPVSLL